MAEAVVTEADLRGAGLLACSLGSREAARIRRDLLAGGLFENLVVLEALKARANRGESPDLSLPDNHGLELDMTYRDGRALVAIEVKSAATLHAKFRDARVRFDGSVAPLERKPLVYDGEARRWSDGTRAGNWRDIDALVYEIDDVAKDDVAIAAPDRRQVAHPTAG